LRFVPADKSDGVVLVTLAVAGSCKDRNFGYYKVIEKKVDGRTLVRDLKERRAFEDYPGSDWEPVITVLCKEARPCRRF